jgi:hypothetical protein
LIGTVDYRTSLVRTPRCVIFINENSSYWKYAAKGAIQCASEIWGGKYFLIVPTDGTRIKEKFWELLEAHSPDYLAVYALSLSDLEEANPTEYARIKEFNRQRYEASGASADFEEWFADARHEPLIDKLTVADDLHKQLIDRLSPFHFQGRAERTLLSKRHGFGYPFTRMPKIIPHAKQKPMKVVLPRSVPSIEAGLIIYSNTGFACDAYRDDLADVNVPPQILPENYNLSHFLEDSFGDSRTDLRFPLPGSWQPAGPYAYQTPFGITSLHVSRHYLAGKHRDYEEKAVIVLGDNADCLLHG